MIPVSCKRLIEVDFPIGVVSEHSAREKSIRHGHPSTLHLWWARRPLAACRAVLMGLLLPDPCDKDCPADFKPKARDLLAKRYTFAKACDDLELRELLLQFIGELANWDNSSNSLYLEVARGLVKAAHPEETPVVVDPFAGGGSIPLEALRLGCEAFASDLNPVACLILKTLLEDIPKYGNTDFTLKDDLPDGKSKEIVVHGLANALRHVGKQVATVAQKELAQFYPRDSDGSRPIAYLWARTVRCEGIGCGAEIPLVRTTWLAKRFNKTKKIYTKLVSLDLLPDKKQKTVDIKITVHKTPAASLPKIPPPTASDGKAICPCCHVVLSDKRVRQQLTEQNGGSDVTLEHNHRVKGARLVTVFLRKDGDIVYRLPNEADYTAVAAAKSKLNTLAKTPNFPQLPAEPLNPVRPSPNARGVSGATRIGITDFGRLFTTRQKLALHALSVAAKDASDSEVLQNMMCLSVTKQVERLSSFVTWINSTEAPRGTFARQALAIAWDFVELVPIAESEEFLGLIDAMASVVEGAFNAHLASGQVQQADATASPLIDSSVHVWFTDPPYYDAIPYADLSDIFYTWLKRVIPQDKLNRLRSSCGDGLTPKSQECTWNQAHVVNGQPKTPAFFESQIASAFGQGSRVLRDDGVGCVVFAHKTTEGWEALLGGLLRGGWVVSASWPIATERSGKLGGKDKAMLMTSVHLVCRPRPADAGVGDWGEVKAAMEKRIREWLPTLVKHGVRGADAIFSCLGPALESYSRYDKVLTAADHEVPLGGDPEATEPHKRGFLAYVFEAVSKEALRQVLGDAETEGFEEDSRMTALFLWTLQGSKTTNKETSGDEPESEDGEVSNADDDESKPKKAKAGFSMPFDTFIRITRPMGIHYPSLEGRVIDLEKGIVRLLPVRERSEQLLGEAAIRPEIDISLKDIQQMELALGVERQVSATQLPTGRKKGGKKAPTTIGSTEIPFTTLDRIHRAMLLFTLGRSVLLRQVLEEDMRQGKEFARLALALNALYPDGCDERRMLEGVQAAMRGIKA